MKNFILIMTAFLIAILISLNIYIYLGNRNIEAQLKDKDKELIEKIYDQRQLLKEGIGLKHADELSSFEETYKKMKDEKKRSEELEERIKAKENIE